MKTTVVITDIMAGSLIIKPPNLGKLLGDTFPMSEVRVQRLYKQLHLLCEGLLLFRLVFLHFLLININHT